MTSIRPPAFVVDEHLALDFLNTTATPQGMRVDCLGQAGSIEPAAAARIRDSGSDAMDEVARQAGEFRRWLRGFVTARMGKPLRATAAAIAPLNELLARDSRFQRVEVAGRDAASGDGLVEDRVCYTPATALRRGIHRAESARSRLKAALIRARWVNA